MEDVLDIYARPYDPAYPVVNMDEASRQLLEDTHEVIRLDDGSTRTDYEYIRHGQRNIFMATAALAGWRTAVVTKRHTMADWARFVKEQVIDRYPQAKKIILICDNLGVHTPAAFYLAYPPEQARELIERLEIHYTPKHGSWLNIAECELSVLQNQCLGERRIPTEAVLAKEVTAWANRRNQTQAGVDWQFTTKDARTKLKRLYPVVVVAA
jgi:hypothetical protein